VEVFLPFGCIWVLLTGSWMFGTIKQLDCLSAASFQLSVESILEAVAGSSKAAKRQKCRNGSWKKK